MKALLLPWALALALAATTLQAGMMGDANCDGEVNSVDARYILVVEVGLVDALPCPGGADVDLNGVVNPIDALLILQFEAGTIDSLPPR